MLEGVTKIRLVSRGGDMGLRLPWAMSASHCRRVHGMGDTVVPIFNKYNLPPEGSRLVS